MTHPTAYLVLPELTPAAIRAGAARATETSDETLAVAMVLLVSSALGDHPDEQAIRDAWHDQPGAVTVSGAAPLAELRGPARYQPPAAS